MRLFENIGFQFFSYLIPILRENYEHLKEPLRILREKRSLDEYLAHSIGFSFFCFTFLLAFLIVFLTILTKDPLFSFLLSFLVSFLFSSFSFLLLLSIPNLKIASLAKKIEKELPISLLTFSTFVSDEIPIEKSFEIFSKTNKHFKLAQEFDEIVRHVKYFGKDIFSAIEYKIMYSPSKKLREILWGIHSTLRGGGSIAEFLKSKANELMAEYRREIREFSRKIVLFVEIYLLLIVLGSLFFIVLTSIFSAISQQPGTVFIQFFLSTVGLPIITLMTMFLMKSIVPYEV